MSSFPGSSLMPAASLRTCRNLFLPLLTTAAAEAADPVIDLTGQWQSRYVSEGRDNVPGSGVFATSLAVDAGGFQVSAVQLLEDQAPEGEVSRYRERNAEISLGGTYAHLDWRVGYKHLWLPVSEEDQEVSLELGAELLPGLATTLTYTHAFEADGGFMELAVEREFSCGLSCRLIPYAMLGANQGFVTDGRRGLNHVQLGSQLVVELGRQVVFGVEINHSIPVRRGSEEALRELTWLGLSLVYRLR